MPTFPALVFAIVLGFASLASAGTSPVPDLTGTWTGKLACKGIGTSPFLFGDFNFVDKAATLSITQLKVVISGGDSVSANLIATIDAEDPDFPFEVHSVMCGPVVVNPAKTKQVRAGLVIAGMPPPGSTFAVDFSSVKVFPVNGKGVTGKLKGKGVLIGLGPSIRGGGFGGTSAGCKWSFERTDDTPPTDPPTDCTDMPV